MESAGKYSKRLSVFAFRSVEVQERRLLAFFQFANSVTFEGHFRQERVLRKNTGLLSEKPHKVLGGWNLQFSQEREENFNFNFRPRTITFVHQ